MTRTTALVQALTTPTLESLEEFVDDLSSDFCDEWVMPPLSGHVGQALTDQASSTCNQQKDAHMENQSGFSALLLGRKENFKGHGITAERKDQQLPLLRLATPSSKGPQATTSATVKPSNTIQHLKDSEKIFDLFYWDEVLQENGSGGKVVVCRRKASHGAAAGEYVMKMRSKRDLCVEGSIAEEARFRKVQERILNLPPHAGVMPIHQVFENDIFFYIVMDKARGGPLLENLLNEFQDGIIPEEELKKLMKEILEALHHLHIHGMLHRDIKPDNIVIQTDEIGKKRIMLIDFDHADVEMGSVKSTLCFDDPQIFGTLPFNAPETFGGRYTAQSDLYSVGVILYLLMTGKMPYCSDLFKSASAGDPKMGWQSRTFQHMKRVCIDFDCDPWPEQSSCMDFCRWLLAFKESDRPSSADKALCHPWLVRAPAIDGVKAVKAYSKAKVAK